ncbi:TPR repeat-containing protein [Pseudomonas aeruginosa]|nr:TPR repeat-containing protein [Pseudomonas aeruginosa]BAP48018.1 TPR repeat-containing protein [Pseudomonas aeruginosa]
MLEPFRQRWMRTPDPSAGTPAYGWRERAVLRPGRGSASLGRTLRFSPCRACAGTPSFPFRPACRHASRQLPGLAPRPAGRPRDRRQPGAPCPAVSSQRNTSGPALRNAGGVPSRVRRRPRPGSPCPGRSAAAHCPRLWPASFPDLRSSSCPLPTMSAIVPGSGQALHGTGGFGRCEGGTRPLRVRRPKPYRRSR